MTTERIPTRDEWVAEIQGMIAHVGSDFAPDEDWMPMGFLQGADGKDALLALDPEFFSSDALKNRLTDTVLPQTIAELGAIRAALLTSNWVTRVTNDDYGRAQFDPETGNPHVRPSVHPGRIEALFLLVADSGGCVGYMAEINRTTDATPVLGEWEEVPDGALGGRFAEALQRPFGLPTMDVEEQAKKFARGEDA